MRFSCMSSYEGWKTCASEKVLPKRPQLSPNGIVRLKNCEKFSFFDKINSKIILKLKRTLKLFTQPAQKSHQVETESEFSLEGNCGKRGESEIFFNFKGVFFYKGESEIW